MLQWGMEPTLEGGLSPDALGLKLKSLVPSGGPGIGAWGDVAEWGEWTPPILRRAGRRLSGLSLFSAAPVPPTPAARPSRA